MSRIGNTPITIPDNTTVELDPSSVMVKGPKGELRFDIPQHITVKKEDNQLIFNRANNTRQARANHGMARSIVSNMITGTTDGYTKKLELVGTGYRAKKQGNKLQITVGYSHPIEVEAPEGITFDVEGNNIISISGVSKQQVGQTAAEIRALRKPEPYKGKGIRYQDEIIRRKAGKAAKALT